MTKAELRAKYIKERDVYMQCGVATNEYALKLDTMLSEYLKLPLCTQDEDLQDGP